MDFVPEVYYLLNVRKPKHFKINLWITPALQHPYADEALLRTGSTGEHKAILREGMAVSAKDLGATEVSKFKETASEWLLFRIFGS